MLRITRIALLTSALSCAASMTASAQDQETGEVVIEPSRRATVPAAPRTSLERPGPLRFYGGFSVAVGGEIHDDDDDDSSINLDPTVGLQGGVEFVVMDYFSIGGEMRFLFPKPDGQAGRDFLWDLVVKPRGRYEFSNLPLEVYGALPIGLTVPGLDGPEEGKVGWNIGLVAGATYFFTENIGVNTEMGWLFHKFGYESGSGFGRIERDLVMNQFLLLFPNFVYAL